MIMGFTRTCTVADDEIMDVPPYSGIMGDGIGVAIGRNVETSEERIEWRISYGYSL